MGLIGNIGSIGTGYYQGQDQALQRQMYQLRLKQMQDQQQQEQMRRQQDAAVSGRMLQDYPQMQAPPPQQAPQPPMPGQQSMPAQSQPQGQLPPPLQIPQMQGTGGMQGGMGQPPQQQQGAPQGMPRPLPPYTSPQAPQPQQQGAQGLPPPPQGGGQQQQFQPMDLMMFASRLKQAHPELDSQAILRVAEQNSGLLNMQGKMQLQAAMIQVKQQQANTTQQGEQRREGFNPDRRDPLQSAQIGKTEAQTEAIQKKMTGSGGAPSGSLKTETVDYYARQSLAGDNSWRAGLARSKVGQQLISAVKDRIPQLAAERDISPEEASGSKGQREALNKTLTDRSKYVAAGNQFVSNFQKQADLVEKYMKPGAAGSLPVINKWIQAGRKATGDPDVSAFDTALRGLAREHQRIVTGVTSNAQLHASAQKTADEILNKDMSPAQIKATLAVMREEATNALDSGKGEVELLKEQLKHVGTKSPTNSGANAWTDADEKRLKELEAKHGSQ